jgi:hypothetical protein
LETRSRKSSPLGISEIRVKGFKSLFQGHAIEVRPLTLLAGANSSGKSSIVQPLLLLKQTLEAPYDPGPLLLDGPNLQFTEARQFLSRVKGQRPADRLEIGLASTRGDRLGLVFVRRKDRGLDIEEMSVERPGEAYTLRRSMDSEEIRRELPARLRTFVPQPGRAAEQRLTVRRYRCFLAVGLGREDQRPIAPPPVLPFPLALVREIERVIHLPGLRGNPERFYRATAVADRFPGPFQTYTASVIQAWQGRESLQDLSRWLQTLGLTWKVEARRLDETRVELRVGRAPRSGRGGARDLVNIADVGFGVSQCLPVLVALLAARPGQIVYLEQPEIHLHPRAQHRLAQILAEAAQRSVRVLAETHSSLLLRGVQTLVAEGGLSPEDVVLHWFHRDDDGFTSVKTAELDQNGAFGDWPVDFDEVTLEAEGAYLDAVEAHHRS